LKELVKGFPAGPAAQIRFQNPHHRLKPRYPSCQLQELPSRNRKADGLADRHPYYRKD
jgi:hypothetical protein